MSKKIRIPLFTLLTMGLLAVLYSLDVPQDLHISQWQQEIKQRPPAEDNGYFYLMGIDVPRGEEPFDFGQRRVEKLLADPTAKVFAGDVLALPSRDVLVRTNDDGFLKSILGQIDLAANQLNDHHEVLRRYQDFKGFERCVDVLPPAIEMPFPKYQYLIEGQQLLFIEAILSAENGEVEAGAELLLKDAKRNRKYLAEADHLIGKMIAVDLVERDVRLLNAYAHYYSNSALQKLIVEELGRLSLAERSLRRAFRHEALLGVNALLALENAPLFRVRSEWEDSVAEQIWFRWHFKANHCANLMLPFWLEAMEYSEREPSKFESLEFPDEVVLSVWDRMYNPGGAALSRIGVPYYQDYIARIHDLDCLLALARASIKSAGIEQLNLQGERNPYTGDPIVLEGDVATFDGPLKDKKGLRSLQVVWH